MNDINKNRDIPWVEKYRPKNFKDLVGAEKTLSELRRFIDTFFELQKNLKTLQKQYINATEKDKRNLKIKINSAKKKLASKKACLLLGPPGVGKTTLAYVIANEYGLSVIETNASDVRTEDAINDKLQETVKSSNLMSFTQKSSKGKLILLDEVDGLHGQSDRGGVSALEKIIKSSKYPIIMTANFRDDQKFKKLYELANPLIEMPTITPNTLAQMIKKIAKNENISVSDEQIKTIVTRAQGDFRAAINDFQGLAQGEKNLNQDDLDNIDKNRDTEINIIEFFKNFYTANNFKEAKKALDNVQQKNLDFRTLHKWFNENLFAYVRNKNDQFWSIHFLAKADNILGYTLRTQDYSHLSYYYDILAGGMKFSKSDKILPKSRLKAPKFFRTRAAPDDPVAKSIQELYRASLDEIMRTIRPKLSKFLDMNPIFIEYLSHYLREDNPKKVKKLIGGK